MKPEIVCRQMQQYLALIRATLAHAPRFAESVARLDNLQAQLANATGDCSMFSAHALSVAYNGLWRITTDAVNTMTAIRQKTDRSRYSSAEKKALQTLVALDGKLSKFKTVIDSYVNADKQLSAYTNDYTANRKRDLNTVRRITETNTHLGYGNCSSLTFPAPTGSQVKACTDFVWLGMQYEKARALGGADGSVPAGHYLRTYERLKKELHDAPPATRATLAQYMSQYEGYLLSEANRSLQRISGGRGELTPDELAKAIRDPAFTQAAAFGAFRQSLENDPLLTYYVRDTRRKTIGRDYPAVEKAVEQVSAPKTGNPYINNAIEDRRTALRNEVYKSGYTTISKDGRMFELYDKICSLDAGKTSRTFQAMATALRKVIDRRDPVNENDPDFHNDMIDCERAAREYVTTQPKKPRSALGKERMAAAKSLLSMARGYAEAYTMHQETANKNKKEELKEQLLNGSEKTKQQKRIELSKLQKVIAPVHTVPKIAKAVNTVSGIRKSGVGHKIANVTNVVMTNTIGLVLGAAAEIATHQSDNGTSKPLNTKLVPGGNGEEYSDSTDENGLFNDRRKIPLVWAREIPEDPVDDIEFSIEVEQAKEGTDLGSSNANGFKEEDAVGNIDEHYGHAFVSLKYTQKDPITGQPKRYKTSFGFYPNSVFNTAAQVANAAQYGSKQVGEIMDDFGHKVSAGQSFKIKPDQFNKIVTLAQNYEKGGYNVTFRNCVDFAKACVDELKLKDAQKLFETTDLNSGVTLHNAGSAIAAGGVGYAVKAISKNELYKLQNAKSFTYQRFGQKLVSEDDLKNQDIVSYNARMKGYSPGLLGEKMREKTDIPIHTNKWEGTEQLQNRVLHSSVFVNSELYRNSVKNNMSENEKTQILKNIAHKYSKQFNLLCLEQQFNQLQQRIRSLPDFDYNDPVNRNALNKMHEFSDNLLDSMATAIDKIDINNEAAFSSNYKYQAVNYPKKKKAFHELTKACKAYTEGMNEIFRNTFHSDPRLNLEFGKVVSFAEQISDIAASEYTDFVKDDHIGFDNLQMLEGEFDPSREALHSMYEAKFQEKDYYYTGKNENGKSSKFQYGYRLTPLDAYAAVKVCGSLGEAVKMNDKRDAHNVNEFADMNKRYDVAVLAKQNLLIKTLGKSMESKLAPDYKPTDEDFKMIFNKLPSSEFQLNAADMRNRKSKNAYFASNALKGLMFEKYFDGFSEQAKNFAKSMRDPEAIKILKAEQPEELEISLENADVEDISLERPDPLLKRAKFINDKKLEMDKKMADFVMNRIATDSNAKRAFERMKFETAKFLYYKKNNRPYYANMPGADKELMKYANDAEAHVMRDIIGTYLEPQLNYQLIREFNGPKATRADKEIYKTLGYSGEINTSERLINFEYTVYPELKEMRFPVPPREPQHEPQNQQNQRNQQNPQNAQNQRIPVNSM